MTGIHDAKPGDIFVDDHDKLWRVIGRWDEPCVQVESLDNPDPIGGMVRQQGGISGLMWKGFKFLHRPKPPAPIVHHHIPSNWLLHMHSDK